MSFAFPLRFIQQGLPAVCSIMVLACFMTPLQAGAAMQNVLVGGTLGSETLANKDNTRQLLATGRVGLYLHELGTEVMDHAGASDKAASNFPGRMVAEFGLPKRNGKYSHADALDFFTHAYPKLFTRHGFHPEDANVNGMVPSGTVDSEADWLDYAAVARANGIKTIAPFADPNDSKLPYDFSDPFWNFMKSVCLKVGGIAVDSPPGFFWEKPETYRQHDLQKIAWGVSHGLRVSVVISPWKKNTDFLKDTQRFVAFFVDHKVLPTEWVVESYDDPVKPAHPGNPVGPETQAETVNAVALWVARSAPVSPH